MSDAILVLDRLNVSYQLDSSRKVQVVHDLSLEVGRGEVVGIVGESGSGKSTLGLSIPRLLPSNGRIESGQVLFRGQDMTRMDRDALQQVRGRGLAMIFQDPSASLNPTFSIATQMIDVQKAHLRRAGPKYGTKELRSRAVAALASVGIPDAADRINDYPYQFSGGMLQRVMIAMAMLLEPDLLIADEPTSALDVTLQAQILHLLRRLNRERSTSILLITHDLGVVSRICTKVVVMYAGRVVETAPIDEVFAHPKHPYTRALLRALPTTGRRGKMLMAIPGGPPRLTNLPDGCKFVERCSYAVDQCHQDEPPLESLGRGTVRCWLADRIQAESLYSDGVVS